MKNVLVVEDEIIIAMDIRYILHQIGIKNVYLVDNGADAIKTVKSVPIELIIMDINIVGNIDGIETAEIIQKIQKIPVIYCSANSDGETIKRAKSTADSVFIEKPFDENEFAEIVMKKFLPANKKAI